MFDCADRALYAAKRRGRNRICRISQLDRGDMRAEQPECLHVAEALAVAGDLREGLPAGHSSEVANLSAAVAEQLGLDEDEVLRAWLGGWLHDVGKIAVPDRILTKPGKLTDDGRSSALIPRSAMSWFAPFPSSRSQPKQPRSTTDATLELERSAGTQFDPAVIDALIAIVHSQAATAATGRAA